MHSGFRIYSKVLDHRVLTPHALWPGLPLLLAIVSVYCAWFYLTVLWIQVLSI